MPKGENMPNRRYRNLVKYSIFILALLTLTANYRPNYGPKAVHAQGERRDRDDRSSFRFKLSMHVSSISQGYLYEYTLRQIDYGRISYQDLNRFSLVLPCGEKGYRSVRDTKLGGWTLDRTGYFDESALGKEVWEVRLIPGFRITPDG